MGAVTGRVDFMPPDEFRSLSTSFAYIQLNANFHIANLCAVLRKTNKNYFILGAYVKYECDTGDIPLEFK